MRLFAGLDLPDAIQQNLGALIGHLRPAAAIRWSPAANLHITTKFIGERSSGDLARIEQALAGVRGPAIEITMRGLGWFPNPHNPRILFAAVRSPESLLDLARSTDAALEPAGVAREKRDYKPHLTLARIEERAELAELRQRIAALESDAFGQFTATAFHLYLSQPGPGGSVYSKLASFPLDQA